MASPASREDDAWNRIPLGTLTRSSGGGWRAKTGGGLATGNVAARFVVRQTGAARAGAELFEPEELDGDDPVTEDGEVITPDGPAAGVTVTELLVLGRTAFRQRRSRSTAPPLTRRTRLRTAGALRRFQPERDARKWRARQARPCARAANMQPRTPSGQPQKNGLAGVSAPSAA